MARPGANFARSVAQCDISDAIVACAGMSALRMAQRLQPSALPSHSEVKFKNKHLDQRLPGRLRS